jgi:hypothetical protein
MPVTELTTLELDAASAQSFGSPTLQTLLHTLSVRQSAYSAYPVTFYMDGTSTSILHIISGWSGSQAYSRWIQSDHSKDVMRQLASFVTVKSVLHIAMDFDSIPRRTFGTMCILYQRSDDEGTTMGGRQDWHSGTNPLVAVWHGGGEDLNPNADAFVRFILYPDVPPDYIFRRHGASAVVMRRRSDPSPHPNYQSGSP